MGFSFGKSVKSVLQLVSANALVKILGFAMVALYTRFLTKEELSVIPVYVLLGSVGITFFGFGLQPTLLKRLPALFKEDRQEALGLMYTGASLLFGGALVFSLGSILLAGPLASMLFRDPGYLALMRIIAVGAFFQCARDITNYLLWANDRFDKISLLLVISAITRSIICGSFVVLYGARGMVLGLVINDVICLTLSLVFLRDLLWKRDVRWHSPGQLLRESIPFYLGSFLTYFRGKGDQWIVATSLGPTALGVYFVAKRVPQMLAVVRSSLDNVMTPQLSRRVNDLEEMALYVRKLKAVLFYAMIPLFLLVIGMVPLIISVMAGAEYAAAIIPSAILCLWQLVQLLQTPATRGVFVVKSPATRVAITAIEASVLLGALLALAPRWEVYGVVTSLLISGLVAWFVAEKFLARAIGNTFSWRSFILAIVPSLIMAGIIVTLMQWRQTPVFAALYAILGLGVFLGIQSLVNSRGFYGALNTVAPISVPDPFRRIFGKHS